ncbi:ribosomal protein S18 [Scheffersomyces amazonensis]|uniref:ribosomal protein S18 n=1 Tax=Scheffersomyces amazonensis TaxID=1078765 RepID=UPI00315DC95C
MISRISSIRSVAVRASNIRSFSQCARLYNDVDNVEKRNILPSNESMKSKELWSGSRDNKNNDMNITKQVAGIARNIEENNQPPLNISPMFQSRFEFGQSYDPFDFSHVKQEMTKRSQQQNRKTTSNVDGDPFEKAGIDPSTLYIYPEILSRYLTTTGQILPRNITGCNAKNQRKLSYAIKTARSIGLLSSTHKHSVTLPSRFL